jgi:hypothetical protein
LASRILSGVQYSPGRACDGGAVWLAPFCANVGRTTVTVEITGTNIGRNDRIADTKPARKHWMLIGMTGPVWLTLHQKRNVADLKLFKSATVCS